ncbi:MAG: dihydroneopterin aldolase [Pseudomonadota bacterium]
MDHVRVENLCIHGFHGVMEQEREIGQRFYLDIDVQVDTRGYTNDDEYGRAVCYAGLCETAQTVSDETKFYLIETFGDRVACAIMERHDTVPQVTVTIRKPSAPIPAALDTVSVSITRTRADLG